MILSKNMKFHRHKHEESVASLSGLLDAHDNRDAFLIRRVVITGCLINAMLMAMKLIVGYYGQSDALVADGFHSLNDVAADIVMLLFVGISFLLWIRQIPDILFISDLGSPSLCSRRNIT